MLMLSALLMQTPSQKIWAETKKSDTEGVHLFNKGQVKKWQTEKGLGLLMTLNTWGEKLMEDKNYFSNVGFYNLILASIFCLW